MEFCNGGTLEDAIHKGVFHRVDHQGRTAVDMEAVCLTLLDIACAMEYLLLMRIFLKDLKPKNVLLVSSQVRAATCIWTLDTHCQSTSHMLLLGRHAGSVKLPVCEFSCP